MPFSRSLLQKPPSIQEIVNLYSNDSQLSKIFHQNEFSLLRWILFSNRAHLISLPEHLKLKEFPQHRQFLSLISNPSAEIKFQAKAKKHGSAGERWHAIFRNGLKVLSGTSGQANGAAHGTGIYFAPNSVTSYQYVRSTSNGYKRSNLGKNVHLIALCEVADVPNINKIQGFTWVVKDESACIVRMLMTGPIMNFDTTQQLLSNLPTLETVIKYQADLLSQVTEHNNHQ
jgi:poly [ADP-ribose] polymerase 6/8